MLGAGSARGPQSHAHVSVGVGRGRRTLSSCAHAAALVSLPIHAPQAVLRVSNRWVRKRLLQHSTRDRCWGAVAASPPEVCDPAGQRGGLGRALRDSKCSSGNHFGRSQKYSSKHSGPQDCFLPPLLLGCCEECSEVWRLSGPPISLLLGKAVPLLPHHHVTCRGHNLNLYESHKSLP